MPPSPFTFIEFQGMIYTLPRPQPNFAVTPTTAICDQRGKCYCPQLTFIYFPVAGNGFISNDYAPVCGYSFTLTCTPGQASGNNCVYIGDPNGVENAGSQQICSNANINIPVTCNVDPTLCSTANLDFCTANPMSGFYTAVINGVTYRLDNNNNLVCDQLAVVVG